MPNLPVYPFEPERLIGRVFLVRPGEIRIDLSTSQLEGSPRFGNRVSSGRIGEFAFVEEAGFAILVRVNQVELRKRAKDSGSSEDIVSRDEPVGVTTPIAQVSLDTGEVTLGVNAYPTVGASAFAAHPMLVKHVLRSQGAGLEAEVVLRFAQIPTLDGHTVEVTPEVLFGRHLAILGSTGGGKSWTVASLLESASHYRPKIVVLDATGEFRTLKNGSHVHLGGADDEDGSRPVTFPYYHLTESDLFAIFRPSGQSQAPKLREAIKSLKLARLDETLANNGLIEKADNDRRQFDQAVLAHAVQLSDPIADFDVTKLAQQIDHECVWPTSNRNANSWGGLNNNDRTYCVSLVSRVETIVGSDHLSCIFDPRQELETFEQVLSTFLASDEPALVVSMKHVSFERNAREIVANAIGRAIMARARAGSFLEKPLLVFVDEAHQFLNKTIGDDWTSHDLDAFATVAKEGRKYGLSICLATQRPRDIPTDVLSQMGSLLVHRLVSDEDRRVVERAAGHVSKDVVSFLPTLAQGDAVLVGADFPIPVTIHVNEPTAKPKSFGPNFQRGWSAVTQDTEGEELRDDAAATPTAEGEPVDVTADGITAENRGHSVI